MSNPATVIAAGGVVWRERRGSRQVLLVHRPRYDDWSLPKGKLAPRRARAGRRPAGDRGGDRPAGGPRPTARRPAVRRPQERRNRAEAGALLVRLARRSGAGVRAERRGRQARVAPGRQGPEQLSYPRDVDILDCLDAVLPVASTVVCCGTRRRSSARNGTARTPSARSARTGLASAERLTGVLAALGVNRSAAAMPSGARRRSRRTPRRSGGGSTAAGDLRARVRRGSVGVAEGGGEGLEAWQGDRGLLAPAGAPGTVREELGLKVGKFSTGAFLVAHRLADGRLVHERFGAP